jgi:hypothetical protein
VLDKRTAFERFADEREHLVPLPRHPYDTARVVYRVCSIDGFVAWAGNQYAVPYGHITASDLKCVARHELAPRGAGLRLDPAGFHTVYKGQSPIDIDQLHIAFGNMGEHAAEFFRLMSQGPPRVWSSQAGNILLLRERRIRPLPVVITTSWAPRVARDIRTLRSLVWLLHRRVEHGFRAAALAHPRAPRQGRDGAAVERAFDHAHDGTRSHTPAVSPSPKRPP